MRTRISNIVSTSLWDKDNPILPLQGFLDVARFTVTDAQPFGSELSSNAFTLTRAAIRLNKEDGVSMGRRLKRSGDDEFLSYQDYVTISRRKATVEQATEAYKEVVRHLNEDERNIYHLHHWEAEAKKVINIGGLATLIAVSFEIRSPVFSASIRLGRFIVPGFCVVQAAEASKATRYGEEEEELGSKSWLEIGLGYGESRLPLNWQELMQRHFEPRLPFANLAPDSCWNLLEWELGAADVVNRGEGFIAVYANRS